MVSAASAVSGKSAPDRDSKGFRKIGRVGSRPVNKQEPSQQPNVEPITHTAFLNADDDENDTVVVEDDGHAFD